MQKNFNKYLTIATFLILSLLWEFISRSKFSNINLFPPPTKVLRSLLESITTGEYFSDVSISLIRAGFGFAIGSAIGICLGILTGRIAIFRLTIGQIAHFLRNIPSIAFVPLAIVWFGIGEASKILLVMWGVIFPVWINTHQGVINIDKTFIWAIKSLGANRFQILKEVIYGSIPFIISGVRIGIAISFITLVAAEMAGAFSGVGYRILTSHLIFRVDKMILGIATLGLMGLIADRCYIMAVKKLFPWVQIR
ncbi:MAG TPA: ABC transporter permease [Candidatus Nanoarchaeia archaeon]|nr:ABC transporter permease [Candidatus Nanoarchaeia archaeon]